MTTEPPLVFTLDAGGTNFVFSAMKKGAFIGDMVRVPAEVTDLDRCLSTLTSGFKQLEKQLGERPDGISFAFPGPADYQQGIIGDLPNLPGFRGGVALGPYLEQQFGVPVRINNDGDLFTLGEAKYGFLPHVHTQLKAAGNTKQYQNLIGVTLGTGFGVGAVINGQLLRGDNGCASEGWLIRNKLFSYTNIEDSVSRRAVKKMYAEQIAIDPSNAPEPSDIYLIAKGEKEGVREAAIETWFRFGDALGDALAHLITILDANVVLGGGLSGAYDQFAGAMIHSLNSTFTALNGKRFPRLIQKTYDLEQSFSRDQFLAPANTTVTIPGTDRRIPYSNIKKAGIGCSKLGTSKAVSLGAYSAALALT
ncbi:MAG: ROK family protein [Bacteroidota bacterium]